ncbi:MULTISPECIES: zinc ABC transporter substrate-binding protein [Paenibacillus]|uniref:metal ABC transporter solute-binding protein, Zn/Mn family n=1 Tax=Paenibacillus TaxID=44249 RepID=UPI000BBDBB3B|nr:MULTISPECIES: zinc ABC transporter substrate-binding protein [Paenibacillus]PCL92957.1 manganese transporter [Paenibacillus lautus]WFB61499.1 zinc ABC transporter substrate-binding protein [Paenibacillus sp. BR1-192]GIP03000.1 manganese-binding lipoprotein MntA [Paenibacillus lautus]
MKNKRTSRGRIFMGAAILGLLLVLSACASGEAKQSGAATEQADKKIRVVTTIGQIAEPISVIGGDRVEVLSLMGPGVDPHLYNATQGDIKKLDSGDVIFYSGLHLEGNMTEIFEQIGKNKPVLAIADAIPKDRLLQDDTQATDPHVWFDIDLWKTSLDSAVEELKSLSPADADYFEENKQKYFAQLDELKAEAKDKLGQIPEEQRVMVTAHDAFGYFGRMHGLEVVGLQGLSTEDEIGLSDINGTIDLLLEHKVPAVFVESSVNPASINAVIEGAAKKGLNIKLGGELFSDAMGETGTTEGTYIGMYRHNVETIYHALTGSGE